MKVVILSNDDIGINEEMTKYWRRKPNIISHPSASNVMWNIENDVVMIQLLLVIYYRNNLSNLCIEEVMKQYY